MRLLLFTNIIPYPLTEGGKVAQFFLIQKLVEMHQVTLVTSGPEHYKKLLNQLQENIPGLSVNLINEDTGIEKKGIIDKVLGIIHWKITKYLGRNKSRETSILENAFFINPIKARSRSFLQQWENIIEKVKPDIVQIDFIDNADIALLVKKPLKKIMVIHDFRFSSIEQAAQIANISPNYVAYLKDMVQTIELAHLKNFDGLITFSKDDASKISELLPDNKIFISPFAVDEKLFLTITPSYKIEKLVFIGPEQHYANLDGLKWFAEEMSDKIFKKFGITTSVIGKWSDEQIKFFEKYPGIKFLGFVENLQEAMQNAAMIVPLRIGSGIRTKIIEAFASGIPVISTQIGCEGLEAFDNKHLLIANDYDGFANAIHQLLNNEINIDELRFAAQELARDKFSPQSVVEKRNEIFRSLSA